MKEKIVKKITKEIIYPKSILKTKNGVVLKFFSKPNSSQMKITNIDDEIGIQISAPPIDGEANKELQNYLSKLFSLNKSQIILIKGEKSKEKYFQINGLEIAEIYEILDQEFKK
jgi:uncharacterized protein